MIRFQGVERRFGEVTALAGLDLEIDTGELIALLGPSGCGKTTALRILGGFDRPDAGRVLVGDKDVTNMPPNKRDMGMVFQAYSLFPNMDVRSNVAFGLRMRRQDKEKRLKRADELLELVGLTQTADRYPHQLSGGQQQRVAIARSLALEPQVMLFDEVTSALDPELTAEVLAVMEDLARRGMTMITVTHEMGFARKVAGLVVFMHKGKVWEVGPTAELFANPRTAEFRQFVSSEL